MINCFLTTFFSKEFIAMVVFDQPGNPKDHGAMPLGSIEIIAYNPWGVIIRQCFWENELPGESFLFTGPGKRSSEKLLIERVLQNPSFFKMPEFINKDTKS